MLMWQSKTLLLACSKRFRRIEPLFVHSEIISSHSQRHQFITDAAAVSTVRSPILILCICHVFFAFAINFVGIFTALHAMQTRSSDENSVRPSVRLSVCLSVTRVYCDKTVERSVQIYTPYERTFILVF